jgi:hypothetical protein
MLCSAYMDETEIRPTYKQTTDTDDWLIEL